MSTLPAAEAVRRVRAALAETGYGHLPIDVGTDDAPLVVERRVFQSIPMAVWWTAIDLLHPGPCWPCWYASGFELVGAAADCADGRCAHEHLPRRPPRALLRPGPGGPPAPAPLNRPHVPRSGVL